MTFFEVAWIAYACAGDFFFKAIPPAARPAAAVVGLCQARPEVEKHSSRHGAERRIAELGQGAAPRLRWCQRLKCWDKPISWRTEATWNR